MNGTIAESTRGRWHGQLDVVGSVLGHASLATQIDVRDAIDTADYPEARQTLLALAERLQLVVETMRDLERDMEENELASADSAADLFVLDLS